MHFESRVRAAWLPGRWWLGLLAAAALAVHAQQQGPLERYLKRQETVTAELERAHEALSAEVNRRCASASEAAGADRYDIDAAFVLHERELALLETFQQELILMLGDDAPPGFLPSPRINRQALLPYIHRPAIDGLVYETAAKTASVAVSPRGLLDRRLSDGRPTDKRYLKALASTLNEPDLYLGTLFQESTARVAARLPVTVPAGAEHAAALLMTGFDRETNDAVDHVIVALIDADRVYFGSTRLQKALPTAPGCIRQFKHQAAQSYSAADLAFLRCYTQAMSGRPEMRQATREAQAFLEGLRPPNVRRLP